jgi:DNA-directed RNA polymerase subunit N (RpoN/RPB10)
MLPPIVCQTCGRSLGDLAPIYRLILEKRMGARYGGASAEGESPPPAPPLVSLDLEQTSNLMGDILEALRLTDCCRTHLVAAQDWRVYYG